VTVQSNHQSLQAVMDWSHDLCTPAEQLLWARLSVFANGWTLDAAETVCSGDDLPADEVADVLAGLVDKSIVGTNLGRSRYELLEPLQQYGYAHLVTAGEDQTLRRRHRDWVASMLCTASNSWYGPDQLDVMCDVRTELANVRAATSWTARTEPESPIGLIMVVDFLRVLVPFFYGLQASSRLLLRDMLDASPAEPSPLRASAIAMGAFVILCQGDRDTAGEILPEALEMAAALPGAPVLPALRMVEGSQLLMSQARPESLPMLAEARDLFAQAGAAGDSTMASMLLALGHALVGEDEHAALDYVAEHMAMVEAHRAPWMISWGQIAIALAYQRFGQSTLAEEYNRTALRDQHRMGDRWGTLWCVEIQAWLAADATACDRNTGRQPELAVRAARVLGAATKLQELTGIRIVGLPPFLRQRELAIARVREVLPAEEYEIAFKQGLAVGSYDHAIALALGERYDGEREPTSAAGPVKSPLTQGQFKVARLVAAGMTSKEVAASLTLSVHSVNSHLENIYRALEINSRAQLARWFTEQELRA